MRTTTERRQLILEYLCEVRSTTRAQLMQEFHVSKNTVDRDLKLLMCSYPIETSRGNGGGVRIAEGYSLGLRYFNPVQLDLIQRLSKTLTGDDLATMQTILKKYTNPVAAKLGRFAKLK